MDKKNFIISLNIFNNCSKEIVEKIIPLFKENVYNEGDIIFEEGIVGTDFYVIYSGQVEIIKNYGKTNQKLLSILNDREIFGETSLFQVSNRTATAVAKTTSVIFSINSQDFKDVLKNFSDDGIKIFQWMLYNTILRLEQTSKELSTINTISFLIIESLNEYVKIEMFLNKVCNEIYNTLGEEFSVCIYVYNFFTEEFELVSRCGIGANFYKQNIDICDKLINVMIKDKKSVYYEESSGEKKFFSPMIFNEEVIGFMLVSTYTSFSQGVKDLISSVINLLSLAIINLRNLEEEQEKRRLKDIRDRYII